MEETNKISKKLAVVIVASAFFCLGFPVGAIKSSGVLFLEFQSVGASAVSASGIGSTLYGAYFFCGPVATILCNKLGYRFTVTIGSLLASTGLICSAFVKSAPLLYLTFAFMFGAGSSLVNTSGYAFAGQIFTTKRPFVNNIIGSGSSLVGIPLAIGLQLWINAYGWWGSMLLLGALILNSFPAGLLMTHTIMHLPQHLSDALKKKKDRKLFDLSLCKDKAFIVYILSTGFHMASMIIVGIYLVRFAQALNIDSTKAASLSSTMSLVDVSCRPIVGYLLSKKELLGWKVDRSFLLAIFMLVQSVAALLIATVSHDFISLIICTIFYSAAIGFAGSLPITVLADLFGSEKLTSSLGIRNFVIGLFSMCTPPLVSLCVAQLYPEYVNISSVDIYRSPFYFSTGCSLISFALLSSVRWFQRRADSNHKALQAIN